MSGPDPLDSAVAAAAALRTREIGAVELVELCIERVAARDGAINAVVWLDEDDARADARRAQERLDGGGDGLPPFLGVPIPIKDLTAVAGWPTTFGSRGAGHEPTRRDAPVVLALRRGGFVLCGRTNTPEFGTLPTTENLRHGITRNPWDTTLTPGGSSGGAAAAVSAGMFALAHGNDGGGSIRVPAACTGVVGVKPSRSRVPNRQRPWDGLVCEGFLTHTVLDAAAALDVVAVPDPAAWAIAPAPARPFAAEVAEVAGDAPRLRVGVLRRAPMGLPVEPAYAEAVSDLADALSDAGHAVADVELELLTPSALGGFLVLQAAGLAAYDGVDWSAVEPQTQAARARAEATDSLAFTTALRRVEAYAHRIASAWGRDFDVLLCPTMTGTPPEAGRIMQLMHDEPASASFDLVRMTAFTTAANLTGLPSISLPTHVDARGLPIGTMLVGGPWGESAMFALAAEIERLRPWADRHPPTP